MSQFEALASQPRQAAASATGDGESMGKLLKENLHLKKEVSAIMCKVYSIHVGMERAWASYLNETFTGATS